LSAVNVENQLNIRAGREIVTVSALALPRRGSPPMSVQSRNRQPASVGIAPRGSAEVHVTGVGGGSGERTGSAADDGANHDPYRAADQPDRGAGRRTSGRAALSSIRLARTAGPQQSCDDEGDNCPHA
jgi:hypothetical protein